MKLYALIGEKLGHSLSCEIHNYIFQKLSLNANYCLMPILKENIPNTISSLKTLGYSGINITIPYKESIIPYLDEISKEAKAIGSVNTVKFTGNKAIGFNTDYFGFGAMVERAGVTIEGKKILILGSGGAAKALIAYIIDNKAKSVTVAARNPEKAGALKVLFPFLEIIPYDAIDAIKGDLLINATPIGMYPNIDGSPADKNILSNFSACADIVYNPLETKFLKTAKSCGCKTINGLYMLIGQALKAQEIFQETSIDKNIGEEIYDYLKIRF